MFSWYSIGLALGIGAFVGTYIGFGLAILICSWYKTAQPEPPPAPADNEPEPDTQAWDDAVARRLLNF